MNVFKDYLDKVIGKHEHIDREWVELQVAEALGENGYQNLMETTNTEDALRFGIMIGVRQSVGGNADDVTIYHNKEIVARKKFPRTSEGEES